MSTASSTTVGKPQEPVKRLMEQCQALELQQHLSAEHPPTTSHTRQRMPQRAVSWNAIDATLRYGTYIYRCGALFVILLRKDIEKFQIPELLPFEGTVVVIRKDGVIATVYINSDAHGRIKKKPKRRPPWKPPTHSAPAIRRRDPRVRFLAAAA